MARVLVCDEGDFDPQTGTCSAPYYGEPPTVIPALSIADAQAIGLSMALLLAFAWVIRQIARMLRES